MPGLVLILEEASWPQNVQNAYQIGMDQIIELYHGVISIIDDITVYSKTEEEYDSNLLNIMKVALENGF